MMQVELSSCQHGPVSGCLLWKFGGKLTVITLYEQCSKGLIIHLKEMPIKNTVDCMKFFYTNYIILTNVGFDRVYIGILISHEKLPIHWHVILHVSQSREEEIWWWDSGRPIIKFSKVTENNNPPYWIKYWMTWWRHQMETFSASLAICAGNLCRSLMNLCRSLMNSPHKGQWCGALMFSLICVWINGWVNNHEAGDLRRYHTHYDIIVMIQIYFHV